MSSVLDDLFDKAVDAGVKYLGNEARDYLADDGGEGEDEDELSEDGDDGGSWFDRGLKSLLGGDDEDEGDSDDDEDDGDGDGDGDWYDKYLGDAAELGARWLGGKAKEWMADDDKPAPQPAPTTPQPKPTTPAADDDPVVGHKTAPGPQVRDHRDAEPYEDDDVVGDLPREPVRDDVDRSAPRPHQETWDGDVPAAPDPAVSQLAPEPDLAPVQEPVQDEFEQQMDTIDQMDNQLDAISGGPE